MVKVTCSQSMVPPERPCHKEHMRNMKAQISWDEKVIANVLFFKK